MSHRIISTILRHDNKQTSYKIALLRSLNDVVLAYSDVRFEDRDVAVPLRRLAESWVAYYWPFVAVERPIDQGVRARRNKQVTNDLAFRPHLTELRRLWEAENHSSGAAGGWVLVDHMRMARKRDAFSKPLLKMYQDTLNRIVRALLQPIKYAGNGHWSVFPKPLSFLDLIGPVPVPGTLERDLCVVVPRALWQAFRDVSLWVEALCVHEWSLFTERVAVCTSRGDAYSLLTERPDPRLPLVWERNNIELLMAEGVQFTCPWTGKSLGRSEFDLDHVVPLDVYPFNELWNLVPADRGFNRIDKRAQLPGPSALASAAPRLQRTYEAYAGAVDLDRAFQDDLSLRFMGIPRDAKSVVVAVTDLIETIALARNVARF